MLNPTSSEITPTSLRVSSMAYWPGSPIVRLAVVRVCSKIQGVGLSSTFNSFNIGQAPVLFVCLVLRFRHITAMVTSSKPPQLVQLALYTFIKKNIQN